ncbi:LAGLIDADG family homing endonuclease [Paenibacillus pini]|uniref:Ribonucleotide reductase n=1 Tax=Paenibacillus pini JCM 16418 TaxID=1236976 RepID=W7YIS1_9BACL|nr:LAGLIDADG family homing endonuclease [Paenibacillus pini]GAF10795.1 ribonucleotide reductase [Paenibacillus pini JCM 16418]
MKWLNENSRNFLSRGYLTEGVTPEQRIRTIATTAENILGIDGFANKFNGYMEKGYYSLSSPVWSNFGIDKGLPISCFGSYLSDDMGGILYTQAEVGMMSKFGGGTSGYFGDLRHRGAQIKDNGQSSGAVHFMKLFETTMDVVSQGSTRRGRFAPYLPIDHPDIEEFLKIGTEGDPIQELTHGVTLTNKWMDEMVAGDVEKRALWAKVIQRRVEIGYPYIFFTDTVNKNTVDVYKDKNLKIYASNLCVAPSTKILTNSGYETIQDLVNNKVDVWNGEEWSEVEVIKTGVNQKLLRVTTDSGYELDCTPYHKFYILKNTETGKRSKPPRYKEVIASDLKVGDKLIKFNLPVIEGDKELEYAYDNGFFTGDGTSVPNTQIIYLYNDKINLLPHIKSVLNWKHEPNNNRVIGRTQILKSKYFVPMSEYSVASRLSWLSGYLDADGTVTNNDGSQSIQAASINKEFLKEVQLMLQTLGVTSKISLAREEGVNLLPKNDGSGELGEYQTNTIHRILINGNSLFQLNSMGLRCNRLKWEIKEPNRECCHFIQIENILELEELSDTYCFTEPKRHMGMFNGVLTGQCSEVMLPSNDEWSFVCNLSSMNLLHYDEWKETDAVETIVFFLDAVMTDFLKKLERMRDSEENEDNLAFYFMEKSYNFAKTNRALGLGGLGWHSYLQSKMIPFESLEASKLNSRIFSFIQNKAHEASKELAKLYGEPEVLKGYGRRNTTLTAIAPTTSSAFILGQVSQSIEPIWSNCYVKDVAKIKVTIQNPYLKEILVSYDKDTRDIWNSIRDNDGSVQHLSFLSDNEREVFKTFCEIDQYIVLDQASTRQLFLDQSQSLNLMINPKISAKQINELYLFAWENNVKTLYYQHSTNAAQQFSKDKLCTSCEA